MCIRDSYGGGYVGYVAGKGKKHTFNRAESFAREKSGGKKVTYTCLLYTSDVYKRQNLPFPVTFTQITWFVITEFIIILFGDIPPLSMICLLYTSYH